MKEFNFRLNKKLKIFLYLLLFWGIFLWLWGFFEFRFAIPLILQGCILVAEIVQIIKRKDARQKAVFLMLLICSVVYLGRSISYLHPVYTTLKVDNLPKGLHIVVKESWDGHVRQYYVELVPGILIGDHTGWGTDIEDDTFQNGDYFAQYYNEDASISIQVKEKNGGYYEEWFFLNAKYLFQWIFEP